VGRRGRRDPVPVLLLPTPGQARRLAEVRKAVAAVEGRMPFCQGRATGGNDAVHVHDLQATVLHCLGVDHERLTYRSQGRDFRLTDVGGEVVEPLLA
jgi:hypothetical protein